MMKKLPLIIWINIAVLLAMCVHVGVAMYLHSQIPSNSAPAWVNLVYAIYYLIPLAGVDLIYWIISRKQK